MTPNTGMEADLVASARQERAAFLARPGNQEKGVDNVIEVPRAPAKAPPPQLVLLKRDWDITD